MAPVLMVLVFIVFLTLSVLNLTVNKNDKFDLYILYGIVMSAMSICCFINYILRPTVVNLFAMIMVICFLLSDIFFVFNKYSHELLIFRLIRNTTQSLAYYFMARYFLLLKNNKRYNKLNHN
ncbi:hypothetical protein I5M07_04130 [Flavobacterium sp. SE-1-e]|uniref:YhhN-like protein n=2 Tax=Flavobacterium agrisoli TaxID=2793066 RepID=A0A934UIN5_9FLAO|nr:hypothetical protein [Flavobacterium agrisoli]MBK0369017.1 hypothetical protein [Flavobacterium agrisoli]